MARGRPKKIVSEPKTQVEPLISPQEAIKSEKDSLEERKVYLYNLREQLVREGVDSIGKLDNLIAQVLKRLGELN